MAVQLKIPEAGESVSEVHIGEWLKSEGDYVEQDEPVVELESDKATMELPAPVSGILSRIIRKKGDVCDVGEVIGEIEEKERSGVEEEGEPAGGAAVEEKKKKERPEEEEEKEKEGEGREKEKAPEEEEEEEKEKEPGPRIMPAAERLLADHDIDPDQIEATGPGGRILKEDVLRFLDSRKEAGEKRPEPGEREAARGREEEVVAMSLLRRKIAERLVDAQQNTAMLTTFNEIDMSAVMRLREENQDRFQEKYGIKLGIMSFFVKASIDALKMIPRVNAEIRGSDIVYRNYYDIGVAVSTERGLVVPFLRDADRMSFAEVETAVADLAGRAREKKIAPEELEGGTFTITNGGVFGSLLSTPILNYPQSGILGLHAIQDRPVVRDGQVVIRPMMYVALTYDHRIIDGRESVTFLNRIKECVESPSRMIIEV